MDRLVKFLRYPLPEKWILFRVSILLGVIRIALIFLPFRQVIQIVKRFAHSNPAFNPADDINQKRIVWAINKAGVPILGDRACLTQALAAQMLLNQRGINSRVRIGVLKDRKGLVQAHAWLESDGGVILGGTETDLKRFTMLPDWDAIDR